MPQKFINGDKVFSRFTNKYITHKKGLFIVAPSGAGKTYYVKNQKQPHWIDGDVFWVATGAHPNDDWWAQGLDVIHGVDQKSDVMTAEAKKLGLWIIGASNYWLVPDAYVIPEWKTQKKYIVKREQEAYDGGAKSEDFKQVLGHRRVLAKMAKQQKVPVFKTIESAVAFLKKKHGM